MDRAWQKLPLLLRSSILAIAISFSGALVWVALSRANRRAMPDVPWAAPVMLGIIALSWRYLDGWGPPRSTMAWRRQSFRARWPARASTPWTILAILSVVAGAQSIIFLSLRLGNFEPDVFAPDLGLRTASPMLVYSSLVMTSLVAAFFEEAGFRGYMQGPLEKRYGPPLAIVATSILFYAIHLFQGWTHGDAITMTSVALSLFVPSVFIGGLALVSESIVPCMAAHTIVDIVSLPFERQIVPGLNLTPVWISGIDRHFLVCCAFLAVAVAGMAVSFTRIRRGRGVLVRAGRGV